MKTRPESDSLGEIQVPVDAYWGAQTARSLGNFPIGEQRMPPALIRAIARIKRCAALANAELGLLDEQRAAWIAQAAGEVIEGRHDDQFPLVVWQTGSGTQTNMNVNEVIAGRANELAGRPRGGKDPVHPNDHVNLGQSSNDVFPSAIHMAAADAISSALLPALQELEDAFEDRRTRFAEVVKIGRTHLMDAVPLTVGQEISGWSGQLAQARPRIAASLEQLYGLVLGGTVVGTGLNAAPGFAAATLERLRRETDLPWREADNRFSAQGSHDALVAASGALRGLAVSLIKIANDVRLLASGPRCGLGELRLPANEPGSSIMPGKINPTQAEALHMVCAQVVGHDTAITVAGMSGHLQLNACKPLIAHCLLQQIGLLADACRSFSRRCIAGLEIDAERIGHNVRDSLMLVTALAPQIGYDAAARAAHRAHAEGTSLREAVLALGLMSAEGYDRLVDPRRLAQSTQEPGSAPD